MEDRGPQCTLLVYIDDATSELMQLKMVESESTFAYMDATREYIERHGKPVAFYSDKHGVFRNNTASANGDGASPATGGCRCATTTPATSFGASTPATTSPRCLPRP